MRTEKVVLSARKLSYFHYNIVHSAIAVGGKYFDTLFNLIPTRGFRYHLEDRNVI